MKHVLLVAGWLWTMSCVGWAAERTPSAGGAAQAARAAVDLSGEWEFKLDPLDVGRAQKWFEPGVAYERKIQVPGAWNAQGVAYESEEQLKAYEAKCLEEQKSLNQLGTLGVQRESERLYSAYPGPGWYRKQVTIPGELNGKVPWLIFDGVHREAEVWLNGKSIGSHVSYLIPFKVDLSGHAKPGDTVQVVVRVDARRRKEVDPLMGCLDTVDFLYITWGGLHGRVRLEAAAAARLDDVFVVPDLASDTADLRIQIEAPSDSSELSIAAEILDGNGVLVGSVGKSLEGRPTQASMTLRIPNAKRWSPKSPYLYTARVRLLTDGVASESRSVRFGMREFKVADGQFLLNGKPIFLRGYGDDSIFPNTICPPADKEEFRRRLSIARDYGFNYVRHHSWTPPREYLDAADELGMMLQPEFPFAYRWDLPTTPEAKRWAIEQWETIIKLNRNHPSIVCWCMGNELYDSFAFAPEMYRSAKRLDPTRVVIDSDGCNFKHKDRETLDFLVVQFGEGSSIGFQDAKYHIPSNVTKPVIAHEMGYFVTLPDLSQLQLFEKGVRPYWLFQARDLAEANGYTGSYPEWLRASYRLQAASLKSNQEAARRSRLKGTSVWLFQDYPNCAEGVVDMFLRPKGVLPEEFRKYNAPTVLLLDAPKRSWQSGETGSFKIVVSRFEDEPSDAATLRWKLSRGEDMVSEGVHKGLRVGADGVQELRELKLEFPRLTKATRLTLGVELDDLNGKTQNSWDLWVFPAELQVESGRRVWADRFDTLRKLYPWMPAGASNSVPSDAEVLVTTRLTESTVDYLTAGGRVMLLEPESAFAVEKTNFRLSSWDGGGPSGTIFDASHPALREMPSDGWCDLQFYPLIQGSKTIQLDALAEKIQPLIRCIDRPTRLANRAYLFEAGVGQGKLLVSGFNFERALESGDAAGRFFLDQLIRYALGPEFKPIVSLPGEALKAKVKP